MKKLSTICLMLTLIPLFGHCHYHHHYSCGGDRGLMNAFAITGIINNSFGIMNNLNSMSNTRTTSYVVQTPTVPVPQPIYIQQPAPQPIIIQAPPQVTPQMLYGSAPSPTPQQPAQPSPQAQGEETKYIEIKNNSEYSGFLMIKEDGKWKSIPVKK